MTNTNVSSVSEAISLGYKYVIAFRDHYRGNSKGDIITCNEANAHISLNHFDMDDRGIHTMIATNEDAPAMVTRRSRIITLIGNVEHSMTSSSRLFSGKKSVWAGTKMVFGHWRNIYKTVEQTGCSNFDSKTFFTRHSCMLNRLRTLLKDTSLVSSTMGVI